jgi:hypothetical protein
VGDDTGPVLRDAQGWARCAGALLKAERVEKGLGSGTSAAGGVCGARGAGCANPVPGGAARGQGEGEEGRRRFEEGPDGRAAGGVVGPARRGAWRASARAAPPRLVKGKRIGGVRRGIRYSIGRQRPSAAPSRGALRRCAGAREMGRRHPGYGPPCRARRMRRARRGRLCTARARARGAARAHRREGAGVGVASTECRGRVRDGAWRGRAPRRGPTPDSILPARVPHRSGGPHAAEGGGARAPRREGAPAPTASARAPRGGVVRVPGAARGL